MPDVIQHAPGLPKTRSGKIMRRVLRKIAVNDRNVGDTSTLADESIVEQLFKNRPEGNKCWNLMANQRTASLSFV